MRLSFTDTETIQLLSILKERKVKYLNLSGLAEARMGNGKFSKNAERLRDRHKAKVEMANCLIGKITMQL